MKNIINKIEVPFWLVITGFVILIIIFLIITLPITIPTLIWDLITGKKPHKVDYGYYHQM